MNFEYIKQTYKVPADMNREVIVNGKKGVITEDMGNYIGVNFYDNPTTHAMAKRERDLSKLIGRPVTIIRDQTKARKGEPIFLEPNNDYPEYQHLGMKEGKEPEALVECNGFCSTED